MGQSAEAERRPLELADVSAFLHEHGWPTVKQIERIPHGEWSTAFSFAIDSATHASIPQPGYVVRFSPLDEDFRKDQLAAAFAEPALPMPKLIESGEALGGYYTIAERATGDYLDALDADGLRRVLPALFEAIDAMREADVSGTTGFGVWDASGRAPAASWREALLLVGEDPRGSRLDGWRDALARSPTGLGPFEAGLQRLQELLAQLPERDVGRHLIHADLLNYNVLVQRAQLSAVLDWGSAMYGDWVFDIAWFAYWQPWYPAWAGIDFTAEARRHFEAIGLWVPAFAERLRCCELVIGLGNQTYCAFRGEERWPQLAEVAERTLLLSRQLD
jgi:hygromycin-B 4-O-kinase